MMTTRDKLLADIDAFLTKADMLPSKLGRSALNDPGFVDRLRSGADCTTGTADKLRAFMAAWKPPKPRPKRAAAQAAA
jgi:hypothetical protein